MKFNSKELASFAAYRIGRADKEGSLWMRESDGIIRKKESKPFTLSLSLPLPHPTPLSLFSVTDYFRRWCVLSGNLLFYTKEEAASSPLAGVIVLERVQVESEAFSGNRNAFRLSE